MAFSNDPRNDQYAGIKKDARTVISAYAKMHGFDHQIALPEQASVAENNFLYVATKPGAGGEFFTKLLRQYEIHSSNTTAGDNRFFYIDVKQLGFREKLCNMARDTLGEMAALQEQLSRAIQKSEGRRNK